MGIGSAMTFCSVLVSGLACASGDLPTLGSTRAAPVAKGDPETCHRLQQDFDIDLRKVVSAGCGPSTEQIAKSMDIHPEDLISSRWNFRLSFIPVIPTFMF